MKEFEDLKEFVHVFKEKLVKSSFALCLTGAGVSTDSGIPDFRSPDGFYSKFSPEIFDIEFFKTKPEEFYRVNIPLIKEFINAKPNITHKMLALLEKKGLLKGVITQNIDGLHEKAGSKKVYNCHGTYRTLHCLKCKKEYKVEDFLLYYEKNGFYCKCGGLIKPDVVFFGESLTKDFFEALKDINKCDVMLVLGTSLSVYPVAGIVEEVFINGTEVFCVNRSIPALSEYITYFYRGNLGEFSNMVYTIFEGI